MMSNIRDTPAKSALFFLFIVNFGFGLMAIFFPLDAAGYEIDFSGEFSLYETLPEDDTPGILNLGFWYGTLSGLMRMGGAFRVSIGIGFGIVLLTGARAKWPIFVMAFAMNICTIFIAYILEPGQGADMSYTGSGTDNARLFQIFHFALIAFVYYRLKNEGVTEGMPNLFGNRPSDN